MLTRKFHRPTLKTISVSLLSLAALSILGCSGDYGSEVIVYGPDEEAENTFVHDQNAFEALDIVSLHDVEAIGSVEKGPFLTGSAIKLYELHGSSLKQTGKSYIGKTKGDKGEFTITAATLNSQYAILEAMGYYKNEVTGHSSNSVLTLIAIVDFKNRRNANINLLTHLEFDRTLALIETGLNVTAAKKQSAFELFNAFYFGNIPEAPEDLSIIGETDGDAALLAVSVLLQGNRKEAAMSEVIANIGEDIAEDGTWDDFKLKTQIADWAFGADLAEIRKNVTDWNLGNVPNFEKYVIMFWTSVYGIKPCTADMEGVQQVINNEYSKYNKETFVCKDERWSKLVVVNEPETIVPNEKDDNKEEIKNDNGNDDKAEIVIIDGITYGYIKDSRDGNTYKVVKIGKQKWMAENLRYNTSLASTTCAGNNCETYGRLYEWKATKTDVCPEGWAVPTNSDWQELYAYVDANNGSESIETSLKSTQSWSVPGSNRFGFSAISAGYNWGGQSDFGSDAAWWSSSEDNHDQGLDWRLYNGANFDDLGMPKDVKFAIRCISIDKEIIITEPSNNPNSNLPSSSEDSNLGTIFADGKIIDTRDNQEYKTVKIGNQVWMAQNLNYAGGDGVCYNNKESNCELYGKLYSWAGAMNLDLAYNNQSWNGNDEKYQGICPQGTHLPSKKEWQTLVNYIGYENSGLMLRSTSGWGGIYNSGNGTDAYGFKALAAGTYAWDFVYIGEDGYWWSATETSSNTAINRDMDMCPNCLYEDSDSKSYKFSVRCIIDEPSNITTSPNESIPNSGNSTQKQPSTSVTAPVESNYSYDCSEFNCVTTKYLNQEMLAAGKYGEFLDTRDNQVYRTIKIGDQVWMAQNLNYASSGSKCYKEDDTYCPTYGRLYPMSAAKGNANEKGYIQGACPVNWHVPSEQDFRTLISYVGGDRIDEIKTEIRSWPTYFSYKNSGTTLKSKIFPWDLEGSGDEFGFSAIPTGMRWDYGDYQHINSSLEAVYWTTTVESDAWGRNITRHINDTDDFVGLHYDISGYLFGIRCIQD